MLGISDSKFSTSAALACAFLIGGCGGDLAPGNVQVALVKADSSSVRSLQASNTHHHEREIANAIVVLKEIDAHVHGVGWQPVMTDPTPVDLVNLDQQRLTILGITKLPSGRIDRLRLVLDPTNAFVITKGGVKRPLELPEGGVVNVVGRLDLDGCAAGTVIVDFDPQFRTSGDDECGCDGASGTACPCRARVGRHRATLRTEEVKGACTPDGGGNPPPTGGQCGNGNTVCAPDQICKNGDCLDPCFGVTCTGSKVCFKGQCVSTDACSQDSDD
jgi:hypothetical protein